MKFDPFNWQEVQANGEVKIQGGRVQVSCSAPAALYVEAEGVETLVSFGTAWDLEFSLPVMLRLDAGPTVRWFIQSQWLECGEPDHEVFTNIDQMPNESGSVLEVRQALRMLEIAGRQQRAEMIELHNELQASRAVPPLEEPDPVDVLEPVEPDQDEGDK